MTLQRNVRKVWTLLIFFFILDCWVLSMTFHGGKQNRSRHWPKAVSKAVFTVALHCCLVSLRSWALLSSQATTDSLFSWTEQEEKASVLWFYGEGLFSCWIVHTTLLGNFTLHNSEVVIICVLGCSTEYLFPPLLSLLPNLSHSDNLIKEKFYEKCISGLVSIVLVQVWTNHSTLQYDFCFINDPLLRSFGWSCSSEYSLKEITSTTVWSLS